MTRKMIITDIDGTLIGNDRRMPPEMERLAQLVREHKLPFTVASGRIQSRIQPVVEALGITLPVIGCNGASAKQGDRYLWNRMIPPHCLKEAIQLADSLGMSVVMTDGEKEYAFRRTPWVADLMDNYGRYDGVRPIAEDEWPSQRIQKALLDDSANSGRMDEIVALLERFPQEVALVRYQSGVLDVMPAGCSKGAAVRQLAEHLGIDLADVVAVGDHQNDMEMISEAGLGVAVGNASPELKACADYVCQAPLCQGVIEMVERFCL